MSRIDYTFDNLGEIGIIKDSAPENMPLNGWTDGKNVRFREGTVQRFSGHDEVFGATTASSGPIFAMSLLKGANQFWFYADENHICATDSAGDHQDLSSGTYAATLDINWGGAQLAGGVAIFNNGLDTPQSWAGTGLTDAVTDLANWPTGMLARVIAAHDQYLVAADLDEGSGRDGTLLRWSHPAAPGAVPASWDYTDTTKTAGRTTIGEGGDRIIDLVKLRDNTIIYKGERCFRMSWIGGRSVFQFRKLFDQVGMLTRRCAKEFYGSHLVVTNSDVVIHDGQSVQSIFNRRWQSYLFNAIDSTNYARTFVAANYRKNEIWICYPEAGNDLPNVALVWNWKDNTIGIRELPAGCAHIEWGIISPGESTAFNSLNGTYADQAGAFDDQSFSGSKLGLLMCSYTRNRFYRADQTNQFDDVDFDCYVQRDFLPLGNVSNNKMVYEPAKIKTVYEIWPIVQAAAGTVIKVWVGTRFNESDSVQWDSQDFTVGTSTYAKFRSAGRIIDVRFSTTAEAPWELLRYRIVYDLSRGSR